MSTPARVSVADGQGRSGSSQAGTVTVAPHPGEGGHPMGRLDAAIAILAVIDVIGILLVCHVVGLI